MDYKYFSSEELSQLETAWKSILRLGVSTQSDLHEIEDRLSCIKEERASRMQVQDLGKSIMVDAAGQDFSSSPPVY